MPFDVRIQSETLVVMDTHAHMSTTEVIGLLGGNYSHGSRTLKVISQICLFYEFSSARLFSVAWPVRTSERP